MDVRVPSTLLRTAAGFVQPPAIVPIWHTS